MTTFWICWASSRVGARMRDWHSRSLGSSLARVPMAKVAVLPCVFMCQEQEKENQERSDVCTVPNTRVGVWWSILSKNEGSDFELGLSTRRGWLFSDSKDGVIFNDRHSPSFFPQYHYDQHKCRLSIFFSLTVPDWACAIKSRPNMVGLIALCWIAEGFSKP